MQQKMASGVFLKPHRGAFYYEILRGEDRALRFDPPVDSEELAIALSYHFPRPKTLEGKMQAAILKYLREKFIPLQPQVESSDSFVGDLLDSSSSHYPSSVLDTVLGQQKLAANLIPPSDIQTSCVSGQITDEYSHLKPEFLNFTSNPSYHDFQSEFHLGIGNTVEENWKDLMAPPNLSSPCQGMELSLQGSGQDTNLPSSPRVSRGYNKIIPWISDLQQSPDWNPVPEIVTSVQLQRGWAWDSKTGLIKHKGKKRKYGALEAEQVAKNRGNTCDKHKRMKTKCDPKKCPGNKSFKYNLPVAPPSPPAGLSRNPPLEQCETKDKNAIVSLSFQSGSSSRSASTKEDSLPTSPTLFSHCEIETDHTHIFRAADDPAGIDAWWQASLSDTRGSSAYAPMIEPDPFCGMGNDILLDLTPTWMEGWDDFTKREKIKQDHKDQHHKPSKDDDDGEDVYEGNWDDEDDGGNFDNHSFGSKGRKDDDDGTGGAGVCGNDSSSTHSVNLEALLWTWKMSSLVAHLQISLLAICLGIAKASTLEQGRELLALSPQGLQEQILAY
ncbi:hypothetical protein BGZ60DRAFT_234751 [Tricladium varicosporioides]|nr:hypothetical protein BGZ60DRAFT_234751 [Hymenoscyphus varicosporioides]